MDNNRSSSSIEIVSPDEDKAIHNKSLRGFQPPRPVFQQLKSEHGWKYATMDKLKHYFPHYNLQTSGKACF